MREVGDQRGYWLWWQEIAGAWSHLGLVTSGHIRKQGIAWK